MNEIPVTVVGNVASDLELRHLTDGVAVTSFRLASTPRRFDRSSGEWKDGATLWVSVSCWRALAENVCNSVRKGDPVVVTGRLAMRTYDAKDGSRHTVTEVEAVTVGHDLWRGTATFTRSARAASPVEPDRGFVAAASAAISAATEGASRNGPLQDPWSAPLTPSRERVPAA